MAAGFGLRGRPDGEYDEDDGTRVTIFSIAELTAGAVESKPQPLRVTDEEAAPTSAKNDGSNDDVITHQRTDSETPSVSNYSGKQALVQGINRPLFHVDLQEAVEAAVTDARTKKF